MVHLMHCIIRDLTVHLFEFINILKYVFRKRVCVIYLLLLLLLQILSTTIVVLSASARRRRAIDSSKKISTRISYKKY